MLDLIKDVILRIRTKDDTADGVSKAKKRMNELAATKELKGLGSGQGIVDTLGKKLGMGMQFAGVAVAGHMFEQATVKMQELQVKMRDGSQDARSIANGLAQSIPVLGDFVRGFNNIREIMTGEQREVDLITQGLAAQVATQEHLLSLDLKRIENARQHRLEVQTTEREIGRIGMRGAQGQRQEIVDAAADAADRRETERKRIKTNTDQAIANSPEAKALADFKKAHQKELDAYETRKSGLIYNGVDTKDVEADYKELNSQKADLEQAVKVAQKKLKQNSTADIGALDEQDVLDKTRQEKKLAEFDKLNNERLIHNQRAHEAEIAMAKANADVAGKETGGEHYAAGQARIEANKQNAIAQAELDAQAQTEATTDAAEQVEIKQRFDDKVAAIVAQSQAELAQLNKDQKLQQKQFNHEAASAEAAAAAASSAEILNIQGDGFKAEQAQRQAAHEQRLRDIEQDAEQQIAVDQDHAEEIRRRAEAQKAQENVSFAKGEREAGRADRDTQYATERKLREGNLDALKSEASMGNIAAAAEARRLEIAARFADKRQELNQLMTDPHTNAAQREQAKLQLASLDAQQKRAEQLANFTGGAAIPGLNISSRGSGSITKAMEQNSPFIMLSKLQQEANKVLAGIKAATEGVANAINNKPKGQPALAGVK